MKKDFKYYFLAIVIALLLLLNAFALAKMGLFMGNLFDSIVNLDWDLFLHYILMISIALFVSFTAPLLAWQLAFRRELNRMLSLKKAIFENDLKTGILQKYEIVDYTTNLETVYINRFLAVWNMVTLLSLFVFAIIAILSIDWRMLLVAIVASILPSSMPLFIQKPLEKRTNDKVKTSQDYQSFVIENLDGKREIKRFRIEEQIQNKYFDINLLEEMARMRLRLMLMNANVIVGGLGGISFLIVFAAGGIMAFKNIITVGSVIALVQLMNYLVDPIINMVNIYNEYIAAKPIYDRLIEKARPIDLEDEKKEDIKTDSKLDLIAENISFTYPKAPKPAIQNFSHKFEYGKKYILSGKSGSGKSTLAKLLVGELEPDLGKISLENSDIANIKSDTLYKYISYIDQNPYIFSATPKENIKLYREIENSKIDEIVSVLDLKDLDQNKILSPDSGISGGQKLRIATARVMIKPTPIIIVDEPTAGLNEELAIKVIEKITKLPSTIICISHNRNPEILKCFDEEIILN
ncbi:MAG: ABC transporter ATP-binding protein [Tissierellia bacterium]|nr:ABC transporter ATP-binding protein [Tissierellia bacterium]